MTIELEKSGLREEKSCGALSRAKTAPLLVGNRGLELQSVTRSLSAPAGSIVASMTFGWLTQDFAEDQLRKRTIYN